MQIVKKYQFATDHSGVSCMDELFPTRCMPWCHKKWSQVRWRHKGIIDRLQ